MEIRKTTGGALHGGAFCGGVMRNPVLLCVLVAFLFLSLAGGCAPGPNQAEKTPDKDGQIAGFFMGLWHGLISPITFVISIFDRHVRLYEVHNNGGWYNFGFVLGAGLFLSGGILGKKHGKRQ
jgi:hypothetical protein